MKNKRYSAVLFLTAALTAFSACGGPTLSSSSTEEESSQGYVMERETMPEYLEGEASEKFIVGMWVGIPEYKSILDEYDRVTGQTAWTDAELKEQYTWIKEAGFTLASTPNGSFSKDHVIRLLESAEEVGIEQLVWDAELNGVLLNTSLSEDEALSRARRILLEYKDYPSFYGNMITDEPNTGEFAALKVAAERYKKLLPDKMFYLNLFPVGAMTAQLGCGTYKEYLSEYEKLGLDYVCYDYYPLVRGTGTSTKLTDSFLYNMQLCREMPSAPEVWTFLQAMGFGNRKEPDCVEDCRIQVNCSLAYGMKAIQWFCYYSPSYGGAENFMPAIIALDGKKTEKYEYVKTANNDAHAFEHVYTNFEWQRVMSFIGSENTKGENSAFNYLDTDNTHLRVDSFASTEDMLVGVFKDGQGRDGFMLANYDLPSSKKTNKVEIKFNHCTKIVYFVNGVRKTAEAADGKLTLELKAGNGAFVLPLYL